MSDKTVLIIGAGPAGMEAANFLAKNNIRVLLLEKEAEPGGHLKNNAILFPDFTEADPVLKNLTDKTFHTNIELRTGSVINKLYREKDRWFAENAQGESFSGDAVLLATGFAPFDATRKEELGYGIYQNVVTSVEFEKMLKAGKIITNEGKTPQRIAFLNCVGSRDEKTGNNYCSRICCINAVKLAVSCRKALPASEVYSFYIDIRMAGQAYEELYRTSQEKYGVNYIRGRVSEAAPTVENKIQLKAEDTLAGLPLRLTVDLLVLMVGMEPSLSTRMLSRQNGIEGEYGFAAPLGLHINDFRTGQDGLFVAGTTKRPLTLPETLADAAAASFQIMEYFNKIV